MPVRTITAEIDGKVRRITADIPDGASMNDIQSAVEQYMKPAQPPPRPKEGAARFVETAEPLVNPANIALGAAEATANPTGFVQGTLGGSGGEYDRDTLLAKAQEFAKTGDYAKAARYAIGYAIPFLGGQITEAGDMMEAGDIAGGLGKTFGIGAATVGPKYVPKAATAVREAAVKIPGAVKSGVGSVATSAVDHAIAKTVGIPKPIVTAGREAIKEAVNKAKASALEPTISATEKFNKLMDEAKATAPSVGEPRIQFPPAPPKRIDPRPERKQETSRVEVEESRPAVRDNEPPYIPPTIEDKLAGLTPEIQEAIRQRRAQPGRGPVLMGGEKAEHGPLAAPLKRPPAAEVPVEQPKAAPDARATAEMLAKELDEVVDSTTRANLAKKLTPKQMAEAEELAAAMGQPPGQRLSLGKVVVKDAEVGTKIAGVNRAAQAEKMAAKLNETGITADMAQRMTAEQWRQVQYAAGADPRSTATHLEKPPSAATQAEAIEMLRNMEKAKAAPVYRIEKKGTGEPPGERWNRLFEGMDTPEHDFSAKSLKKFEPGEGIFGFPDIATLKTWVSRKSLAQLRKEGFRITRYNPDEAVISKSGQQVLFKRNKPVPASGARAEAQAIEEARKVESPVKLGTGSDDIALAKPTIAALESEGLLEESGARALELAMRRTSLSEPEVRGIAVEASRRARGKATGKHVADVYQELDQNTLDSNSKARQEAFANWRPAPPPPLPDIPLEVGKLRNTLRSGPNGNWHVSESVVEVRPKADFSEGGWDVRMGDIKIEVTARNEVKGGRANPPRGTDPVWRLWDAKKKQPIPGAHSMTRKEAIAKAQEVVKKQWGSTGKETSKDAITSTLSQKPISMEALSSATGIAKDELIGKVFELELAGIVKQLPGGLFTLWKK